MKVEDDKNQILHCVQNDIKSVEHSKMSSCGAIMKYVVYTHDKIIKKLGNLQLEKTKTIMNLQELLLCVSNAQDMINPILSNHHQQVAYLSYRLAEQLNYPLYEQKSIFLAALVHDIGALSINERLSIIDTEPAYIYDHALSGAKLLEGFKPLKKEANIIRYHHTSWENGNGSYFRGEKVPRGSHIIHIADRTCIKIKSGHNVLTQLPSILEAIKNKKNSTFDPVMVDALYTLSKKEYIWLDIISETPVRKLPPGLFDMLPMDIDDIIDFSAVLSRIVDFRSKFTSRHSAGVAKTAHRLAEYMDFSVLECKMMLIAGYFHDIGKLTISNEVLEKPTSLNEEEFDEIRSHTYYTYQLLDAIPQFETIKKWASYHHERLNGEGYPFKIKGDNLTLGSRIMAVADVFTAITENRPYRKGMDSDKAISILKNMVENGSIDQYIVKTLINNFQEINSIREMAQKEASYRYEEFLNEKAISL